MRGHAIRMMDQCTGKLKRTMGQICNGRLSRKTVQGSRRHQRQAKILLSPNQALLSLVILAAVMILAATILAAVIPAAVIPAAAIIQAIPMAMLTTHRKSHMMHTTHSKNPMTRITMMLTTR